MTLVALRKERRSALSLPETAPERSLGFFISVFYNDASPTGLKIRVHPCSSVFKLLKPA
jgi:hypothetical protein